MGDFLADIVYWIQQLSPGWVYLALFVTAVLENVIPPLPGDILIVFGGYLIGLGYIAFTPVLILSTVGGSMGFMMMYALGYRMGAPVFDVDRMRWINKHLAHKARRWTLKYGFRVVAANRFLSGARSVIALTVGATRLDAAPVAFWATVSSGVWCLLIISLGVYLGEEWEAVGGWLAIYGKTVFVLLLLLVTLYSAKRIRERRLARRSREDLF